MDHESVRNMFSSSSWMHQELVLVTVEVKDKHWQRLRLLPLLVVDSCWATESGLLLSHHLSRPTLQLLQNNPLRPRVDKNSLACLLGRFKGGTLRSGDDRVIPDKPPQFTTVVRQAFFSICQLQRRRPVDNCIETLDLQFAMYVAEPLRWGAASFVC